MDIKIINKNQSNNKLERILYCNNKNNNARAFSVTSRLVFRVKVLNSFRIYYVPRYVYG